MALKDKLDQDFANSLIKKVMIGTNKNKQVAVAGNDNVIVSQDNIVKMSDSLTSLQNAFNTIYAHSLNIRNLQQFQEKRLQTIKKESNIESKLGAGGAMMPAMPDSQSSAGVSAEKIDELAEKIKDLNDKLENMDMSGGLGGSNVLGEAGGLALGFSKIGRRLIGPLGALIDIGMRYSEGQSAGQIASGVGGGLLGSFVGGQLGGVIGSIFGPVGRGVGALIGGFGGYYGGSQLGDKAYDYIQGRADGGIVKAGGTYVVGERGPEVVTFNGMSGRVRPNGSGGTPASEKYIMRAAEQSARARAKLEEPRQLGSTSYSSKFSNYLSSLFSSIPNWVENIRKFFSPTQTGPAGQLGPGQYAAVGDLSKVSGEWKNDTEFINAVNEVAQKYNIDANDLLGLIYNETGGTFSPTITNNIGAVGLFQFIPKYFDTRAIARMSRAEQVRYADRNIFGPNGLPNGANAGQLYASVYLPGIARNQNWSGVLARKGHRYYDQNRGLDKNRDDVIDFADLAQVISEHRVRMGLGPSPSLMPGGEGLYEATVPTNLTGGTPIGTQANQQYLSRGGQHEGVDIPAGYGLPVRAAAAGRVEFREDPAGYGHYIRLHHSDGRTMTLYGHLSSRARGLNSGDTVAQGQLIGAIGSTGGRSTGNHLHFELRVDGKLVNPTNYYNARQWIVGARGDVAAPVTPTATPVAAAPQRLNGALLLAGYREVTRNGIRGVTTPGGTFIPSYANRPQEVLGYNGPVPVSVKTDIENYFRLRGR